MREREKRRVTRKACKILREYCDDGGFHGTKRAVWTIAKQRTLEDRDALPVEEVNLVRDYNAMHEDNFLRSWLREDTEGKDEEVEEMRRTNEEETKK